MTVTRNQLIAAIAGVVVLIGGAAYIARGTTPPSPPAQAEVPLLPTGDVTGLSAEAQGRVTGLAISAMMAVFLHETGHMLITELKLPAVGPQEDVADEFATFVMTEALKETPEAQKNVMADVVYSGALFWKIAAQEHAKAGGGITWYDEHSPDERRYYNILCLATGADPLRFIPRAVKDGVPENRLQRCALDYKMKREAWDQLMKPHEPGWWSRLFGTHHLTIEYGPVMKAEWGAFENVYRQGLIFQPLFDGVGKAVNLPRDIPVVIKGCGAVNAWWSPDEKRITLCHDFFSYLTEMFARALVASQQADNAGGAPAPAPGGGAPAPAPGGGAPAPAPGGGTGVSPAALVGVWTCQVVINGVQAREQMTLQPNRTFQAQVFVNGMNISAWGRWSVQANVMRYDYDGPPGTPSPEFVPFQMPQPNIVQTQTGTCQKVGRP